MLANIPTDAGAQPRRRDRLAALLPLDRPAALGAAALAIVYAALAALCLRWLAAPGVGAAFWPVAGVAAAALVIGGPRLWPGVLLGQLVASALVARGPPGAHEAMVAVGATLAAILPAVIFRRLRLESDLTTLNAVLGLVIGEAGGATVFAASGMLAYATSGSSEPEVIRVGLIWWFGHLAAVVSVGAALLSWRSRPRLSRWARVHLGAAVASCVALTYAIFLWSPADLLRSWYIFPALVWPALAFSVRGVSLALVGVAVMGSVAVILGHGPFMNPAAGVNVGDRLLLTQQFLAVVSATLLILAAVADERRGREQLRASERRLQEEMEALEVLNRTGAAIAAELDLDAAVRAVTDAGVSLSGAQFGAFFYNVTDETGESYMLFALSGATRESFTRFGQPRNTPVFAPVFAGERTVRSDDITLDSRYGQNPPHRGTPPGHPPVRSFLAAPVKSRSGEVIGGLFFGHERPGVFTLRTERLITGVANQAAIAIDNARLYQAAQREIDERRRAEEHQRLLMNELNHRVKNTLATVQSMGAQTLRSGRDLAEAREAFVSRLMALSAAHNLLTAESWESADLEDLVRLAVAVFDEPGGTRFSVEGPGVRLKAPTALGLAMALHELGANAQKYGALSGEGGRVEIGWTLEPSGLVRFGWEERDGPAVEPPLRRGFGSRLIQEGLARELNGEVTMDWRPEGLCCVLSFHLDRAEQEGLDAGFDDEPQAG